MRTRELELARKGRGHVAGVAIFGSAFAALAPAIGVIGDLRFGPAAPIAATDNTANTATSAPAASTSIPVAPAPPPAPASAAAFAPPADDTMPVGAYGDAVRLGQRIVVDTPRYAKPYTGNDLSCSNCHLDAGRRAGAAPLWAAFVRYPSYRAKSGRVDTLAMRLQACFTFSQNGTAPKADDPVLVALQAYAGWLATGARVGMPIAGAGFPALAPPPVPADRARGAAVYAQHCASCHGADGLGRRAGERVLFPPLWGARSFNAGAGMAQIETAAAFIRANMPLGQGGTLDAQQAWDVAAFVVGHARPLGPRTRPTAPPARRGLQAGARRRD